MKKFFLVLGMMFTIIISANAQLKVSNAGKVSIGTTSNSNSTLSVNSTGNSNYAAYVNGNFKATNGYVNAFSFQPTQFENLTEGSLSGVLSKLLMLTPKVYIPTGPIPPVPSQAIIKHLAIPGANMDTYFPDLVEVDESNNYIANYAELVPALVTSVQVLRYILAQVEPTLTERYFPSYRGGEEATEDTENDSPTEPLMAAQRLSDNKLFQNDPNPFTAQTEIRFRLTEDAQNAFIYIFDMTGKMLKQIPVDTSMQSVTINGYELSAGIYLYSLAVNGQEIDTKRMILSN